MKFRKRKTDMIKGKIVHRILLAGLLLAPLAGLHAALPAAAGKTDLEKVFVTPPDIAKPGVWWHWMGCNVSKEGITRDLEAFKAAGFSSASIFGMADVCTPWAGNIENSPNNGLIAFTDPWWKLVRFAASEGKRLGFDVGVHNCPGYTSSGGPWITPELSMQVVCHSQTAVDGGVTFSGRLPRPQVDVHGNNMFPMYCGVTDRVENPPIPERLTYFQDIAVIALPAEGVVAKDHVIDLTSRMHADGQLEWTAPLGKWIIYRVGHTTAGTLTQPAQWEAHGLECDKMSDKAVGFHMNHVVGDLQRNLGDLLGTGLQHVLFDSYEAGTPSWTPLMSQEFKQRRGYDVTPFLATFAGRIVGSPDDTGKFNADFQRTIFDLYRENYFPVVQRVLNEAKLRFACEPYGGPWEISGAAPHIDRVMTEFWSGVQFGGDTQEGFFNAGNGKRHNILEAESFTGGPNVSAWTETPAWLKSTGDGAFLAGINRLILHSAVHQPWDERFRPGNSMGQWGTHFGRFQTWWEPGKAWVSYLQRCQAILQWGEHAPTAFSVVSGLKVNAIHRHDADADAWFVANTGSISGESRCLFTVTGKQPELWDPTTGAKRDLSDFEDANGKTSVTLHFAPTQSWLVIFRKAAVKSTVITDNFPALTTVRLIDGEWDVSFDPKWGGPAHASFTKLEDWTKRPEVGIRYYSGTAIYRTTFDSPKSGSRLDLGTVNHLARVRLNGTDLGVAWCPPWSVAIPANVLKTSDNHLEIEVTNVWANRLIGDEQEPADCEWLPGHMGNGGFLKHFPDWFVKGDPRPSKGRYCFVTWNYFNKDSLLIPSGLLGPVTVQAEDTGDLERRK